LELPYTHFHTIENNPIDELLEGRTIVDRSYAHFYFNKEGPVQEILHAIKYLGRTDLAENLGREMAAFLVDEDWFSDIDCILPIPLHKKKMAQRGYNQATALAQGLAEISQIPMRENVLKRIKNTDSQTKKSRLQRIENMEGAFEASLEIEKYEHILLVDDVLTTASTFESAISAIGEKCGAKMSILSLALAIDS